MGDEVSAVEPDPRPRTAVDGGRVVVVGLRCTACGYPTASDVPRCPLCRGAVVEETFSSDGEIFASTVLRIRMPGRISPYGLAYLLLEDGPRVLVHTPSESAVPVGSRARIVSLTEEGDLFAEIIPGGRR